MKAHVHLESKIAKISFIETVSNANYIRQVSNLYEISFQVVSVFAIGKRPCKRYGGVTTSGFKRFGVDANFWYFSINT